MRLMHAANHLCYGDFAGKNMHQIVVRRNLLTIEEIDRLKKAGGSFYLVAVRLHAPTPHAPYITNPA